MTIFNRLLISAAIVLISALTAAYFFPAHSSSVTISAYVASVCSNGTQESTEQCDGSDLNGQTCAGLGYDGGTLSCSANCTFNTSSCTTAVAPPSGGGGGGAYIPPATGVIIQGKAYPNAPLTVLKDGQVIVLTKADSLSDFKVHITAITAGSYTFSVWAEDKDGNKSVTFSFPTTITSGTVTTISGIFLSPTINLNKQSVNRGDVLDIYGQTAPQSNIEVYVYSDEIIEKTTADKSGIWKHSLDTSILTQGSHLTKAKASISDLFSIFSQSLSFLVGQGASGIIKKADINNDNRVNLIDFSILLLNWGNNPSNPTADYNGDGKVNIVDFSILMYWWTG